MTEREVKMAESAKVFFVVLMDRDDIKVNKGLKNKNRKLNRRIKPAISTEQAWSIKVLFYGQNKKPFFAGQSEKYTTIATQDSRHWPN